MIVDVAYFGWRRFLCLCTHTFVGAARTLGVRKWGVRLLISGASVLVTTGLPAYADVVWHCSRGGSAPQAAPADQEPASDFVSPTKQPMAILPNDTRLVGGKFSNFDLSITNLIELELSDIYGVYSGEPISMGRTHLSACFIRGNSRVHREAMDLVGIAPSSVEALSKASAIVKSRLYPVADEEQMQACIERRHPALGYLRDATITDGIAPCF